MMGVHLGLTDRAAGKKINQETLKPIKLEIKHLGFRIIPVWC